MLRLPFREARMRPVPEIIRDDRQMLSANDDPVGCRPVARPRREEGREQRVDVRREIARARNGCRAVRDRRGCVSATAAAPGSRKLVSVNAATKQH